MMEGNWITMPGVTLITAGDLEATVREEGKVTGAPGDGARAAEETTGPTTEEERVDRQQDLRSKSSAPRLPRRPFLLRLPPPKLPPSQKLTLFLRLTRPSRLPSSPKRTPEQTLRRRRTSWSLRPYC
jgi:hypothetical protein